MAPEQSRPHKVVPVVEDCAPELDRFRFRPKCLRTRAKRILVLSSKSIGPPVRTMGPAASLGHEHLVASVEKPLRQREEVGCPHAAGDRQDE